MWSSRKLLCLAGAGSALLLIGCSADYLTGQLPLPDGPIQVTRLTLFDASSRDNPVFTDTSLPDCATAPDCTVAENADLSICRICYNDVFKDMYSAKKSPPTPDSAQDMRVVFNKPPIYLGATELAANDDPTDTDDPVDSKMALANAAKLSCSDCAGVPAMKHQLFVTGSDVTFDPTTVPYGPSIRMFVDPAEPRAALEPGSHYSIQVGNVAGRDMLTYLPSADQTAYLTFSTEAFMLLRVGNGAAADAYVYSASQPGTYQIADQPLDAAVVLQTNAPISGTNLSAVPVTATLSGGSTVPVQLGINGYKKGDAACGKNNQRQLYVFPTGMTSWPMGTNELTIQIPASSITDLSQDGAWAPGKHKIGNAITITVKFSAMSMTTGYKKVADAQAAAMCQ